MCGIIAMYQPRGARICASALARGLSQLEHRGPDGREMWLSERGDMALGHNRLSIVGLDNGRQPIRTIDGNLVAVVNGELYEHRKIRGTLERAGHVFTTESDSEIILHLYRQYGIEGLETLRGEFAFVLVDVERGSMIAGRDRAGVKPLYYAKRGTTVWIGSEIKALLAAGVEARWNIGSYAKRSFCLSNETLFEGVTSLAPGHLLFCDQGKVEEKQYWKLSFPASSATKTDAGSSREFAEQLRSTIVEAVDLRLEADVPVAFYLSGGVDSSAMLGVGTERAGAGRHAFHISFDEGTGYDESIYANKAAEFCGSTLHTLTIDDADLSDNFEEAVWHNEVPFFNAHGVAKFLLSKSVREAGFKAVITGEGADEVFAGYPHFKRDMALFNAEHQDPSVIADLRRKIGLQSASAGVFVKQDEIRKMTHFLGHGVGWMENQIQYHSIIRDLYSGWMQSTYASVQPFLRCCEELRHAILDRIDPVHRSMHLWWTTYLPNFVLTTLGDRMEMAHSVEGRVPLLDHKVVELAATIPVHLKINGRSEKAIFREAMRPFVHPELLERKKHYFRSPPGLSNKQRHLRQLMEDTLSSRYLNELPFFDARAVRKKWQDAVGTSDEAKAMADPVFTEIVSLCLLQKRYALTV